MSGAGDELVDILDDDGRPVEVVSRREMRRRRLPHRCVYLLVFNSRGELFVHLRTPTKDVYPAHWDVTVGGVPAAGEPLSAAAHREGREELGVELAPVPCFAHRYADAFTVVQGMVYVARHDGPFRLQAEEVVRGEFVPLADLPARLAVQPFCPDGLSVLAEWQHRCREVGTPPGR